MVVCCNGGDPAVCLMREKPRQKAAQSLSILFILPQNHTLLDPPLRAVLNADPSEGWDLMALTSLLSHMWLSHAVPLRPFYPLA